MPALSRPVAAMLLAAFALTMLPACTQRLQRERDALYAQNQELQDELDRARAALDAAQARNAELERRLAERPEPIAPAQSRSGFTGIEGVETFTSPAGNVTVRVPGDVLFASGKIDLRSSARSTLSEIAGVINGEYAGETIRVEGYTDTDPIRKSKWKDNLELSLQRAAAVERFLVERGVDGDRIYSAGFGEAKPRATKAQSRRVEIVVVLN